MSKRAIKRDSWQGKLAYDLWVLSQASEAETCHACKISAETLRRWRKYFEWDRERKQQAQGFAVMYLVIHKQIDALARKMDVAQDVDLKYINSLSKTLNNLLNHLERLKKIERNVDYKRFAIRWAREFVQYLEERDIEALKAVRPNMNGFVRKIAGA